jgi:putative ABC transport system ATP-binding protein
MITLEAENLSKIYRAEGEEIAAVRDVSLSLEAGQLALLMGPSGSGKTTLLSILGCILTPDAGTLRVAGDEVEWSERSLPLLRRRAFGFIYQHFNLLESLSVRENVGIPLALAGRHAGDAEDALEIVGMKHRAGFLPAKLSGGEKQRVAIARAIAADAPLLLADEPTGNLDTENGRAVFSTLRRLASEEEKTVLVVTHDERYLPFADRVFRMQDGELQEA